jgi:hypothetical protein
MSRGPREIFDHIRTLSAGSADVDPFVQAIHELVSVMQMAIGSVIEPGQKRYRATNHHTAVPQFTSEIMYPPANRVRSLGRCNGVGQSVFYCSCDQNCVVEEISPSVGDLVVRATWQTTKRMTLQDVGFTLEVLARAGVTRALPNKYRKFVETLTEDARAIRDYIASAFTDRTDRHYALTAAIAEVHLRFDEVVGVMYPSITRNANVDKLALQPSLVDQGLALVAAEALRVRRWNATDPDAYGIADLAAVEQDGRRVWSTQVMS